MRAAHEARSDPRLTVEQPVGYLRPVAHAVTIAGVVKAMEYEG